LSIKNNPSAPSAGVHANSSSNLLILYYILAKLLRGRINCYLKLSREKECLSTISPEAATDNAEAQLHLQVFSKYVLS